MFLADLRVYKMLPECVGKEFYQKKKYPCPLKVHGFDDPSELQKQLSRACKATFFVQGNGPNYSLKVGTTAQSSEQIAANVEKALPEALAYVTAWDDIKFSQLQVVGVKVGDVELPVFNQLTKSEVLAYIDNQQ